MRINLVVSSLMILFTLCSSLSYATSIYIIDSYHSSYPWGKSERQGFEETINPSYKLTYYEMDTKRIDKSLFQARADEIWSKIITNKPDLVVTMDDNALKYLGQRIVNAGFPLVFLGVNNDPRTYFDNHELPDNVAGVLERPPLKQNLNLISQLVPTLNKRVLIMMDSGTTSNSIRLHTLDDKDVIDVDGTTLEVFMTNSFSEWKSRVTTLNRDNYDALVIGSYASLRNNDNQQVPDDTVSEWTCIHSGIPVFTFWQHGAGKGKAMGGIAVSGYFQGASAAKAVNQILTSGKFPYVEVPEIGEVILSEQELSRWGIELPNFIRKRSIMLE